MPRATKRKVSITDNTSTDDVAPKKATRAPRKLPTNRTEQRGSKNTSSSQGARASTGSSSALKKRKAGINDAKRQVQKQGDDLVEFIETQLNSSPSHGFNNTTADRELGSHLSPVLPWIPAPHTNWTTQAPPNPPALMTKALDDLQGIIDVYEKINTQSNGIQKPSWMRWEQDGQELSELNEHAMSFAAQTVNYTIMPGRHGPSTGPLASAGDIERVAWELIEPGGPKMSEETWGTAAQDQVKSFTGVLRLLPPEK
ncbi:hypothetical protein B0J13DRAFT_545269 [Dactylonectria estremocensis]|uniref:Uncharacterized protein n=1 Tax=Dactylonectria estremocensis TaxID=1079267 RepID=A0A9P9F8J3_9HYPO|nr:hypothetical protein B0J13DRAFT_545269 [Dactylonectria estremocensis]